METKNSNLILNIVKILLGAVGVVACLFLFFGPGPDTDIEVQNAFANSVAMNTAIYYSISIIIIAVVLIFLFFFVQLFTNTKRTVISIVGVIVAAVLFFILWGIGSSDTTQQLGVDEQHQGSISWISAGLMVTLIAIGVATLAALAGPIYGRLRK